MTVASTLAKAGPYVCDGAQDTFPFAFPVLDASHVAVYLSKGDTESRLSEGFTVSLTESGGSVVFGTAPAQGSRVAIIRDTPYDQQVDLQNNTAFYPELLESMSDKLTMLVQQLREELSRCVKLAVASGESPESVVAMILGAKDMVLDSASTAASAAAACSSAQLTIATIWAEITGDSASAEAAIDALREAWEAAGSVAAAAEAGKASVNEASLAAVEYAKGQITEAQDASLGVLSATTKSRKEELLALIAETVGAEGTVAAAVQAAKDAAEAAAEESGKIETLSASVQASISAAVTVADQKKQEAQTAANEAAAQAEAAGDSAATAYSYIAQTLANKNAALAAQAAAEAAKADAVAAAGSASTVANASVTAHNASADAHPGTFVKCSGDSVITSGNLTLQDGGNSSKGNVVCPRVQASASVVTKYLCASEGEVECRVTSGGEPYYRWNRGTLMADLRLRSDGSLYAWDPTNSKNVHFKVRSMEIEGKTVDEAFLRITVNDVAWSEMFINSSGHMCFRTPGTQNINGVLHAGELVLEGIGSVGSSVHSMSTGKTSYPNYAAGLDVKSAYNDNAKSYTFPSDGWVLAYPASTGKMYINGGSVPVVKSSDASQECVFIPVRAGDTISGSTANFMAFFPNR